MLLITNKHKSRKISQIELVNLKANIVASAPTTQQIDHKGHAEVCIEIGLDGNDTGVEFSGQLNYQVESKTKSAKTKKLKFFNHLSMFTLLNTWSINDDELVDLLHTKFFTVSIEQDYSFRFRRLK